MKFLLLFTLFSLPLMAQEDKTQKGGIKDIGKISKEFPLYLIDGKKLSRWSLKTKKLQPDDIAEILVFFREEAKNLFGSSAKYGGKFCPCKSCKPSLNSAVVYYTEAGRRYHSSTDCPAMRSSVHEIPLSQAISEGRHACPRCGG